MAFRSSSAGRPTDRRRRAGVLSRNLHLRRIMQFRMDTTFGPNLTISKLTDHHGFDYTLWQATMRYGHAATTLFCWLPGAMCERGMLCCCLPASERVQHHSLEESTPYFGRRGAHAQLADERLDVALHVQHAPLQEAMLRSLSSSANKTLRKPPVVVAPHCQESFWFVRWVTTSSLELMIQSAAHQASKLQLLRCCEMKEV